MHTPYTKLNNQYQTLNNEDLWETYSRKLEESDVAVFSLTDYFCCENYFKFLKHHTQKYPNSKKVFFLNIEFRLDVAVNKNGEEVNLHIIFSDKVSKSEVDSFLMGLKTSLTNVSGAPINCKNLSKEDFVRATVNHRDIKDALRIIFGNDTPYIVLAASNNAGLRADNNSPRKLAISDEVDKICDAFFGGTQNTNYFLQTDRYEDNIISEPKPVFSGCDAHSFEDLDSFLGKHVEKVNQKSNKTETIKDITWVKADPTFLGLLQTLKEPERRLFIGEFPEKLKVVDANKIFFIDSLEIYKLQNSPLTDKWLDSTKISLNHDLVTIIGNKGSGKSALADIIALLGNSKQAAYFSFLNKNRFRENKGNIYLARQFEGVLTSKNSNDKNSLNLSQDPFSTATERIRYIPQGHFENLCNDNKTGRENAFQKELEKVIFDHTSNDMRQGSFNFDDLLEKQEFNYRNQLAELRKKLFIINTEIENIENQCQSHIKQEIVGELSLKNREISDHHDNKPLAVNKPSEQLTEEQKNTSIILTKISLEIKK